MVFRFALLFCFVISIKWSVAWKDDLGPIGPPGTASDVFSDIFKYVPQRLVSVEQNKGSDTQYPEDPGYQHLTEIPTGSQLDRLLTESVRLDLTRRAEVVAAAVCGFPRPGPHDSRKRQRPLYFAFQDDPLHAQLISAVLAAHSGDIKARATALCRAWSINGFAAGGATGRGRRGRMRKLPAALLAITPQGVLAGRIAAAEAADAASPLYKGAQSPPPPPAAAPTSSSEGAAPLPAQFALGPLPSAAQAPGQVEFVELGRPAATQRAPPYRPEPGWDGWDAAALEVLFTDPGKVEKGRRGWVLSPWS